MRVCRASLCSAFHTSALIGLTLAQFARFSMLNRCLGTGWERSFWLAVKFCESESVQAKKTAQTEGCYNFMSPYMSIPIQEYLHNIMSQSDQHDWYSKCLASAALFTVRFLFMNDEYRLLIPADIDSYSYIFSDSLIKSLIPTYWQNYVNCWNSHWII